MWLEIKFSIKVSVKVIITEKGICRKTSYIIFTYCSSLRAAQELLSLIESGWVSRQQKKLVRAVSQKP